MDRNKKILVSGGAGYIGSHTVVELVHAGFTPVIVDDFRNSNPLVLEGIERITGSKVICHDCDVSDMTAFRKVFMTHDFAGIIHFAAYKAVGESVDHPLKYYRNNINSLLAILELAEEFSVDNFVFSSSCTVYGFIQENTIVTEDTPLLPANSPYGATKQMGERILSDAVKASKQLKVLHLRYFNPVGAHETGLIGELPIGKPNNLLPYVTQTGVGLLECLTVFGNDYNTADGTCVRDYIHVTDLAIAHIKGVEWLSEQDKGTEDVFNVGTGKGTSVLEIINTFEEVSGQRLNWKFGPRRSGDVEQIFANTSKIESMTSWKANRSVKDAIRDAWNWEQKRGND
ncbi:MAG: UDP-glucose 4-epimerase GalE [Crocinitomicaceae bacterium]|nr:UDP-glucose 4-epimerase GalE [Crocinitomicaceae bacterium]